jgi:hypothetical protein
MVFKKGFERMRNFIDALMEFFGLKQPARQKLPKLKAAVKPAVKELPAIPSITPKHARIVFKKKEFVQPLALKKKKFSWKPRHGRFAAKTSRTALQFEVEKVLKEAIALKKKLEKMHGKGKKHLKKKSQKKQVLRVGKKFRHLVLQEKQVLLVGKKFKHLTSQEIEEFRKRLKSKGRLSDSEIERMKAHLSSGIESKASDFGIFRKRLKSKGQLSDSGVERMKVHLGSAGIGVMKERLNGINEIPLGKIPVPSGKGQAVQQQAEQPQAVVAASAEVPETIDGQIEATEELLKRLETDFLKRRISEQEYRQKTFELKQKLNELHIKKKLNAEKQGTALQKPFAKTGVAKAFLGQASGKRNEGKIEELHGLVRELVKRAKIPESVVQAEVSKIDKAKLFGNAEKVVDLIELEQKTQKLMQEHLGLEKQERQAVEKTEFGTGFESGMPARKKEEIKEIVAELEKHKIITDFDKILELIQSKGKISSSDAVKELNISKQRLNECLEVLEESKLVKVEFPPIGSAMIFDANYLPPVLKARNSKGKEF